MASVTCVSCGFQNVGDARFCGGCALALGASPVTGPGSAAPSRGGDNTPDRSGLVLGGGRYRLERQLGVGGMGEVYEAWDSRFELRVALKLLAAHLMGSTRVHERMLNEARAMARINHPNVVRVFDVFEAEGGELVLVLELVTGGDLGELVAEGGLIWSRIRTLMAGLLAGLSAIHDAGLVHRDVKPANVLLGAGDQAKVTDLGIAREVDGRLKTQTGLALGTAGYMSPEQVRGQKVDFRSDLYSAGVVLFELASGRLPFEAESDFDLQVAQVQAEPDWARLPPVLGLEVFLRRTLGKAPDQRWTSAGEMREVLEALGTRGESPRGGSGVPVARHRVVVAAKSGPSVPPTPGRSGVAPGAPAAPEAGVPEPPQGPAPPSGRGIAGRIAAMRAALNKPVQAVSIKSRFQRLALALLVFVFFVAMKGTSRQVSEGLILSGFFCLLVAGYQTIAIVLSAALRVFKR